MPVDFDGELLTRATIWMAMLGWCLGIFFSGAERFLYARLAWTLALLFYGLHIVLAYEFFYNHDHAVAWEATAMDTERLVGIRSGFGLIVNFVFLFFLTLDVILQWLRGRRIWEKLIDGAVVFMLVNGAIVFGDGPVRWYGAILVVMLIGRWIYSFRKARID